MAQKAVTWFLIIIISTASGQRIGSSTLPRNGICKSVICHIYLKSLNALADCVVVMGNLQISTMETTNNDDFRNISFPKLREVTGFIVIYRVQGLESLGQLFPNLARIRGKQVQSDYGLVIYDMLELREIGLYSLLKIDRGGVIAWALPQACFVNTVDWKTIAPRSRHVINPPDKHAHCNVLCTCSTNVSVNHCWNNRKCQRFLHGPERENCHKQCLGCRKTNPNECAVCRYFTYKGNCVTRCPSGTMVLPDNQYCITEKECKELDGWAWNNTCVFECPVGYVVKKTETGVTCRYCVTCQKTCESQVIQTTATIQAAERCVFINGSLVIHVRDVPDVMKELRTYLSRIEEVSDYVVMYSSITINSLDFLSSLRHIRGRKLKNEKYSFVVHDMVTLQTLFTANVTKNLKIGRGTLRMHDNPMLCMSHVDKIRQLFPIQPSEIDTPLGSNGYSGGCEEVSVGFQIRVVNETSVVITFSPLVDNDVHYTILYVRIPPGVNETVVPESCSESKWYVVNVPTSIGHNGIFHLTSLRPASTYAVCIETYDPVHQRLARSNILNFTTQVGIPEPPFIVELVASLSDVIVLRWVNHKDYHPHITRYELDVSLINYSDNIANIDYCRNVFEELLEFDYTRHAVVMRPPPEYDRACRESMCGILSSVPVGALVEEYFDVCSDTDLDCNNQEDLPPKNSTFENYLSTLSLNISCPRNDFQVGGLAPFRDYRFRLRACAGDQCSRSARGVVRTLQSSIADIPTLIFAYADALGHVSVKWEPPDITNGILLSYTIEVLPKVHLSTLTHLLPQAWCVSSNTTSFVAKSVSASKYKVRVCSRTLASVNTCSNWLTVETTKGVTSYWWMGVIFGILLYASSTMVGSLWQPREDRSELLSLVNTLVTPVESEPPSSILSEIAPVYSIPIKGVCEIEQ